MQSISESELSILIPLLAAKIRDLSQEIDATEAAAEDDDAAFETRADAQEMLQQYDRLLSELGERYETGRKADRLTLRPFAELVAPFE